MIFHTNGLLSKWGFGDGDIIDEMAYDLDIVFADQPDDILSGDHQALIKIVKTHIIPKLDQKVEVVEIATIHNPIRAVKVDGQNVEDYWCDTNRPEILTPATIEISDEEIITIMKEFATAGTPPA